MCIRDRWLTAFVCQGRLFEFNRTPFGMRNAGQTFVRAIQIILRAMRQFADAYVDDCAVMSDEWYAHLMHLEKILSTMKAEGITLKLKKCRFAQHNDCKVLRRNIWLSLTSTGHRKGLSH